MQKLMANGSKVNNFGYGIQNRKENKSGKIYGKIKIRNT